MRDFHCYPNGTLEMLPWEKDKFVDRLAYDLAEPPTIYGVILCALISQDMRHKKIKVVSAQPTVEEIKRYYLTHLS